MNRNEQSIILLSIGMFILAITSMLSHYKLNELTERVDRCTEDRP